MYMATNIPMLLYLFARHKAITARTVVVVLIGFCFVSLMITGSRSGVLCVTAIAFAYAWFSRHRLALMAAVIFLAIATWVALPEQYKVRYGSMTGEEIDASSQGRLDAWMAGLEMFVEKPLLGVGPGVFAAAYLERKGIWLYSHSLYIEAISTTGLLGAFAWGFFMYIILKILADMNRRRGSPAGKRNKIQVFVRASYAILAGLFLAGVFGHILFRDTWYILAGLITAGSNTLLREGEEEV